MSRPIRATALAGLVALLVLAVLPSRPSAAAGARPTTAPVASSPAATAAAADTFPDPGASGPDAVTIADFDQGAQAFRPEGFGAAVEIQGRVYAPATLTGRRPVAILLHGRHVTCGAKIGGLDKIELEWPCRNGLQPIPSYQGYDKLATNLASNGIVVVSISANGINGNDETVADSGASARAQLVLEHLRRLREWDAGTSPLGDRFAGHLDLGRVGLMGHSRGGEGVVAAAQLNQRIGAPYGIRAVEALAPADFARRDLGGVALHVTLPYCDGDLSDLQGIDYFDDSRYAYPGDPAPRSTSLLFGANHNYFNTVWTRGIGSDDDTSFEAHSGTAAGSCGWKSPSRLKAVEQEQTGATLMAGFLRRHLLDDQSLQPFVTGAAPAPPSVGRARWVSAYHAPERLDLDRWDDASTIRIDRFGVPVRKTGIRSTVCRAKLEQSATRDGSEWVPCPAGYVTDFRSSSAFLDTTWVRRGGFIRIPLNPRATDGRAFDTLRLRASVDTAFLNSDRPTQDFSLLLEDVHGHRAQVSAAAWSNALRRYPRGQELHVVPGGIRVPLTSFPGIDLGRLRAVELRFDRTPRGRILLGDLALTQEGSGRHTGQLDGPPAAPGPSPACATNAASRWVCTTTQLVLGRAPRDAERAAWSRLATTQSGRKRVARQLLATREAKTDRLAVTGTNLLQLSVTPTNLSLPKRLPTLEEGYRLVGRDVASRMASQPGQAVDAIYQTFLGRTPSPRERAHWSPAIRGGARTLLRGALWGSEGRRFRTKEAYRLLLGRQPTTAELRRGSATLGRGGGEDLLIAGLLSGTDFYRANARS